MPNINEIQSQYVKNHLKQVIDIEDVFPNHKFHCYKRCYEMIIAPTRNVSYKALAREKAANRELQKLSEEVKNKIKEIMQNNKIDQLDHPKGVNFK